ncbi:MAG: hypothetical protein K9K64_01710 [Desulfohalobiaceae bacterium]|nr:hypothetical protein [Desulfohalobiaceae bacterium]
MVPGFRQFFLHADKFFQLLSEPQSFFYVLFEILAHEFQLRNPGIDMQFLKRTQGKRYIEDEGQDEDGHGTQNNHDAFFVA